MKSAGADLSRQQPAGSGFPPEPLSETARLGPLARVERRCFAARVPVCFRSVTAVGVDSRVIVSGVEVLLTVIQ